MIREVPPRDDRRVKSKKKGVRVSRRGSRDGHFKDFTEEKIQVQKHRRSYKEQGREQTIYVTSWI